MGGDELERKMNVKCGFWVYRRRSRRLPSTNSCTPQDRNSTLCPKEIGFLGRTRAGKCFSGASKLCENDRRARARTTRSEEGLTQQGLQDGDRYCCWSRQGTRRDQEGEEGFSSQEEGGKFIHLFTFEGPVRWGTESVGREAAGVWRSAASSDRTTLGLLP